MVGLMWETRIFILQLSNQMVPAQPVIIDSFALTDFGQRYPVLFISCGSFL